MPCHGAGLQPAELCHSGLPPGSGHDLFSAPAGDYYLQVRSPGEPLAFLPRYYPGVLYPEEAVLVQVSSGVDLSGMDIALTQEEQFHVAFHHLIPEYVPAGPEGLPCYLNEIEDARREDMIEVRMRPTAPGPIRRGPYRLALEATGDDAWVSAPLPRGEYDFLILYASDLCTALNRLSPIARLSVVVDDEDVDLGTLPQQAKTTVTGRITIQTRQPGTLDLTKLPEFVLSNPVFGIRQARSEVDAFIGGGNIDDL